jgi:hypothetical protein
MSMVKYTKRQKAMCKKAMYDAFSDELEKVAAGFLMDVGGKIINSVKAGWNASSHLPGKGWLGQGYNPAADAGTLGKAFEGVTSLGGATKYLPVGQKSLTLGFGGLDMANASKKEDPMGEGRSRAERFGGAIGGTLTGLGTAHLGFAKGMAASIAGSYGGSLAGRAIKGRKKVEPQQVEAPQASEK